MKPTIKVQDVDDFIDQMVKGTYDDTKLPEFGPNTIKAFLLYGEDHRKIKAPLCAPHSDFYLEECTVGMYALWMIEGIRMRENELDIFTFPSRCPFVYSVDDEGNVNKLHPEIDKDIQTAVYNAYSFWWKSVKDIPFTLGAEEVPLATTNLKWY